MADDAASTSVRSSAGSVASMKKWGIPHQQVPEITLLERLVWVKYKTHWWPALLYYSYSELQHHLYDQLNMVLKAQFTMAIMRQLQERRKMKVARLLGRSILEVIEIEDDSYCEFYWQLPNVLPKACRKSHYGDDIEKYFDFHRALDQVEDIIREVSQENFALLPNNGGGGGGAHQTWLNRAHVALDMGEDDQSSVIRDSTASNSLRSRDVSVDVDVDVNVDVDVKGNVEDDSSTIATNEVSVWSSCKGADKSSKNNKSSKSSKSSNSSNSNSRSRSLSSVDEFGIETRLREPTISSRDDTVKNYPQELGSTTSLNGRRSHQNQEFPSRVGIVSDLSVTSGSVLSSQHSIRSTQSSRSCFRQESRSGHRPHRVGKMQIEPIPSQLSSKTSVSSSNAWDTKSRRSTKSKVSEANTEKVDNRTLTRLSNEMEIPIRPPSTNLQEQQVATFVAPTESRNLTQRMLSNEVETPIRPPSITNLQEQQAATFVTTIESRNPLPGLQFDSSTEHSRSSLHSIATSTSTSAVQSKRISPIQVLPGLEGDDIVPGLSAKVAGARDSWKDVMGILNESREHPEEALGDRVTPLSMTMRDVSDIPETAETVPTGAVKTTTVVYPPKEPQLSFWQRFTCYSAD